MSELPVRDEFDPLADLLQPVGPSHGRRQEVFERTARVLCRRRWSRRAALVLVLLGCYGAGLATMRLIRPSTPVKEPIRAGDKVTGRLEHK